jgi:hypothetical protein
LTCRPQGTMRAWRRCWHLLKGDASCQPALRGSCWAPVRGSADPVLTRCSVSGPHLFAALLSAHTSPCSRLYLLKADRDARLSPALLLHDYISRHPLRAFGPWYRKHLHGNMYLWHWTFREFCDSSVPASPVSIGEQRIETENFFANPDTVFILAPSQRKLVTMCLLASPSLSVCPQARIAGPVFLILVNFTKICRNCPILDKNRTTITNLFYVHRERNSLNIYRSENVWNKSCRQK